MSSMLGFLLVSLTFRAYFSRAAMTRPREFYRSLPKVDFSLSHVEETDVVYKLFQDSSESVGTILTKDNVKTANFNRTIPTIFLIHGWTTDDTSPWYGPLKDEYFKLGSHNVLYLNWSKAGNKSYFESSANVKPTGKFIAEFLVESGIFPSQIHLIGHSLGSHLSGFIGKYFYELTSNKIGRITALDPAGPIFNNPQMKIEERLNENDAEFVDVIHSDIEYSGYASPMGHVDYYPNGGKHQPGCPSREINDNCSHARSTLYFIESLSIETKAKEANYHEENFEVIVTLKENGKDVIFGQHIDLSVRGVYYLETNLEKPFLKIM